MMTWASRQQNKRLWNLVEMWREDSKAQGHWQPGKYIALRYAKQLEDVLMGNGGAGEDNADVQA